MAKEFTTLFDKVMSSCFTPGEQPGAFFSSNELKQKLFQARRFVLDDDMSAFLGDLSSVAFKRANNKESQKHIIEAMRTGARLPHKLTWIEYNLRKCHEYIRHHNQYMIASSINGKVSKLEEIPSSEGWLLEQHHKIETAFRATLFIYDDRYDSTGFNMWSFPWAYVWTTDDSPMPWGKTVIPVTDPEQVNLSALITGLIGYQSVHVSVQCTEVLVTTDKKTWESTLNLLKEWAGVIRRIWALLSTINDLPILVKDVKPSRGYMAGRNYRRFLDHKVISLTVPQTEYRKLAKSVVAQARRRAHQVRGHWRNDFRHPLNKLCEHQFVTTEAHLECSICKGRKVWIVEHQRGDASLGFVTHDYQIGYKPLNEKENI